MRKPGLVDPAPSLCATGRRCWPTLAHSSLSLPSCDEMAPELKRYRPPVSAGIRHGPIAFCSSHPRSPHAPPSVPGYAGVTRRGLGTRRTLPRKWHDPRSGPWTMDQQLPPPTPPTPGLDHLAADVTLADSLPGAILAERARRAARLAADLQTVLLARAASNDPASSGSDRLLAIPKVAEILGFTEPYVYELIRRGHLPAFRSGKYVRVSASVVDSFMKNGPRIVVDESLYHRHSVGRGRLGVARAQDARRVDAGGPRRQDRRRAEQRRPLGACSCSKASRPPTCSDSSGTPRFSSRSTPTASGCRWGTRPP
jgi:excisionase family DNA binding protein